MTRCPICNQSFSRRDAMRRHVHNVHDSVKDTDPLQPLNNMTNMTFQHPFSMMVTGPSQSGKTEWMRKLLLSSLIQPPPERILWCFGQWQPLYEQLQKRIPYIEFVHVIPDIILDDLMTEAKCDQRIADLFTKGSHHRNISIVYLTQNVFPQGKACRDIALNTQYLVPHCTLTIQLTDSRWRPWQEEFTLPPVSHL